MDIQRVFSDQPRDGVDVLLITMPFGPLKRPSIGLSLLQAGLHQASVSSKILYFTLLFAKRIGAATYEQIAGGTFALTNQVGEWIFSAALFPGEDPSTYIETVLLANDPYHWQDAMTRRVQLEGLSEHLLAVRNQVNNFIDECLLIVLQYHPKIVGFTNTFQQQLASLALAKRIKAQLPQTAILFGGANVEGIMGVELVRQFPFVDAAISGEGDIVFPDVVARLLQKRSISDLPGVYTQHNCDLTGNSTDAPNASTVHTMDNLPYPDYNDFFTQQRELSLDIPIRLLYETSRGCWWGAKSHCIFCGLNGSTMNFRSKSPDRAVRELVYLAEHYPGHPVAAVDNILDMHYFKTFLPVLAELDLNLDLFYEVKANLKKEQLRLLRQAHIRMIQPGIESLSTPVLHMMRKGVRALQNIQLLKWCVELGINPYWNLIWGFPGEPREEYARMAQLIPLLAHLSPPYGAGQIRLDRFSPLFVAAEHYGLINVRPNPCYRYIYVGIPDQSLANLAYYFTFEYQDGRDVPSYTQDVTLAIDLWKRDHDPSFLHVMYHHEDVIIWDLRPIAPQMMIRLTGLERDLYLACDTIQGLDALIKIVKPYVGKISRDELRELMQNFVDMKIMLVEDDTYLSLAVWLDEGYQCMKQYKDALATLDRFQQLPELYRMNVSAISIPADVPQTA